MLERRDPPTPTSENVASDPTAVSRGNYLDVFWKDPSGRLKHKWYPYNNGWSWEQDLGADLASGPSAISRGAGQLDVFWRAKADGRIKHIWYPYNNDWSWVQDLGGGVDMQ